MVMNLVKDFKMGWLYNKEEFGGYTSVPYPCCDLCGEGMTSVLEFFRCKAHPTFLWSHSAWYAHQLSLPVPKKPLWMTSQVQQECERILSIKARGFGRTAEFIQDTAERLTAIAIDNLYNKPLLPQ